MLEVVPNELNLQKHHSGKEGPNY